MCHSVHGTLNLSQRLLADVGRCHRVEIVARPANVPRSDRDAVQLCLSRSCQISAVVSAYLNSAVISSRVPRHCVSICLCLYSFVQESDNDNAK